MKISESNTTIKEVWIEKSPFTIVLLTRLNTGWWYSGMDGRRFQVRLGTKNHLSNREGYSEHLLNGFYVVAQIGFYEGACIEKQDAFRMI